MEQKFASFVDSNLETSVLEIHYSIVHQGEEQINKSDSIQGILPEKNMNFETTYDEDAK